MALKAKIDKATYDALPADVQKEYKASGMDFVLDLEGYEDPVELKRAKDREKQRADEAERKRQEAETRATELQSQLDDESTAGARKKGDIATLEAAWKKKVEDTKAAADALAARLKGSIVKLLRDGTATELATELGGDAAPILLPHILSRIDVDFTGDEPVARVLGADGKVSALTVAELKQEFVANPVFSSIITGSNASGGGAGGGKQTGGGAAKKLSEMSEPERIKAKQADPQGFAKMVEAEQSSETAIRI